MEILKLDIDDKELDFEDFSDWCLYVFDTLDLQACNAKVSTTRHGFHIVFWLKNAGLHNVEIVFLQLLLGSDKKRELYGYRRLRDGADTWNTLFAKKTDMHGKVLSEEKYNSQATRFIEERLCGGV